MGKAIADRHGEARAVFDTADRSLGFSLSKLCFEGPDEELQLTENTQPAILATSTALERVLRRSSVRPAYVAGHSLGEYSALVAAGALEFEAALGLVRKRGRYMQEAVPVGKGAMAAILGLSDEDVANVCRRVVESSEDWIVSPANLNGAGQVVIAGHAEAVNRACDEAKAAGAKRAILLSVSAPFHCALMEPAARRLASDLDEAQLSDLDVPLFTNVDAKPITKGSEAREALERQVASPVKWGETIEALADHGVTRFAEVGPGRVLSGLARKIVRGAETYAVEAPESVDNFLEEARLV
jgi:[acyl-carrier-protein] S-malonyltransferase